LFGLVVFRLQQSGPWTAGRAAPGTHIANLQRLNSVLDRPAVFFEGSGGVFSGNGWRPQIFARRPAHEATSGRELAIEFTPQELPFLCLLISNLWAVRLF